MHRPEKKGLDEVAAIVPLKPASDVQSSEGTLVPVESEGQLVAAQLHGEERTRRGRGDRAAEARIA